jgi:hypothetical protein
MYCVQRLLWCRLHLLIVNFYELCFMKALLATLPCLAVIVYCLHIDYSAWYNTSFRVVYMLCLVNASCTRANISPQDTHTHVPFHVALERPKRPLATDSWFTVRAHVRVRPSGLTGTI